MSHRDEGYSMGKGYIIIILIGSAVNSVYIVTMMQTYVDITKYDKTWGKDEEGAVQVLNLHLLKHL